MSIFELNQKTKHDKRNCFLDEPVAIARYERLKYPFFDKLTERQLGYFWRPQEIEITRDQRDFKKLSDIEQHIFTSNLKRQILLDSVQGRAPALAFSPICSLPELEVWMQTWTFSETIHSKSYTHIIRNVYNDPSKVFDEITNIGEIIDCAKDISVYYDDLINTNACYTFDKKLVDSYSHKKKIWLALNAVNVLEGIRFYVSFACSWAFAEQGKMVGNASIIKLIARDENLHLAGTQKLLDLLVKEDKDFEKISKECEAEVLEMFESAIEQEKQWAAYLFKEGSIIGLNEQMLSDYIDWIGAKRMSSIGLPTFTKRGPNPLPWTEKWIGGSDVQVAPQESSIESYIVGSVKQDVTTDTFKGMSL